MTKKVTHLYLAFPSPGLWWIFLIAFHTRKQVYFKPLILYIKINVKNWSTSINTMSSKSRNSSWTYSNPAYSHPKPVQNSSWKRVTTVMDVKIGRESLRTGCLHICHFAASLKLSWSFFEASQYRQKLKIKVA